MSEITGLVFNFERNGKGDAARRLRAHERLASMNPHLVLRQEMWGSERDGAAVLYELEDVLGLRAWLGQGASTAVFADPAVFRPLREYVQSASVWVQPPTALAFRFAPAGGESLPIVVASYHLNYASEAGRLAEAQWLTNFADTGWEMPDGRQVKLPAIMGGDNNSYPVAAEGELPLPVLNQIDDRPHRVHRSYVSTGGRRLMDTRPDETLRLAGLEDVARHWAGTRNGTSAALARTSSSSPTHGPDSRIDRAYASRLLLPAVTGVDVIEVEPDVSDHHIVRFRLDADILADILNGQVQPAAA
jgi:endonuclease/exonuclease/phosphatase family metal-dependent hydrolase